MKNKKALLIIGIIVFLLFGTTSRFLFNNSNEGFRTENVVIKSAGAEILADGKIKSQNEANLHFQIGGKLTYLPFKEGDSVIAGQTIAQLDSYTLQQQLESTLNNYLTTRLSFDQSQANANTGVLQGAQKFNLETTNKIGIGGQDEVDVINGTVKTILEQNQANLNNSVINVQIANKALELATLTSPINGILTHSDLASANVNITPQTSFVVSDPDSLVFQAQVLENDINFVGTGNLATIKINGNTNKIFKGTVVKIYPEKVILPNGNKVYNVDIQSDDLKTDAKFDQGGTAVIESNTNSSVMLVPSWLVLSYQYIWVIDNNKPVFKKVTVGKSHGENIEITKGLVTGEKLIINPKSILEKAY